jgi:hypothetical protein
MTTTDPGGPVGPAVAPAIVSPPAPRRTRLAGALLIAACPLVAVGALLPWLSAVRVDLTSGASVPLFTVQAWRSSCGLVFLLFAIALVVPLARAGLRAVRGRPPGLGRRGAVWLALLALVGTMVFEDLLYLAAALSTLGLLGWNHEPASRVVTITAEAGFPVSLAGYLLSGIASLLLPSRARAGN